MGAREGTRKSHSPLLPSGVRRCVHRRDRPRQTAAEVLAEAAAVAEREVGALAAPLERAQLTTALLRDVASLQRRVSALRMAAVAELRGIGWSYRAIGTALGLSPNAIAQIEKQRLGAGPAESTS